MQRQIKVIRVYAAASYSPSMSAFNSFSSEQDSDVLAKKQYHYKLQRKFDNSDYDAMKKLHMHRAKSIQLDQDRSRQGAAAFTKALKGILGRGEERQ